jgi:predicted site-specific integrase-resolvase
MHRSTELDADELVGAAVAAELLSVDRSTLNRWVAAGRLTPHHALPGRTGARLYRRGDVERLRIEVAAQAVGA